MPSQEDIDATQALLRTHRQTLQLLLDQQAKLGVYAPPGVLIGIGEARQAIGQAKAALREWGVAVDDLPADAESGPATPATPLGGIAPAGDVIIGTVGAGAQGVAIGKQITQNIGAASNPADDRRAIEARVQACEQALGGAELPDAVAPVAAFQMRLLAGELSKVGAQGTPSASTISQVGGWLLDNVPELHAPLAALFNAPETRRVLSRADTPLDAWLKERFGG
jgi:hypothetical protein